MAEPGGLSSREAAARLASEGANLLPSGAPKSRLAIVREVLGEPMFLLLASGGIYLALESLRDLSAPRALVRRDGCEMRIAGRDVVRGDCLILHEGDRIAADARLLEGRLEVDESLLTGEAVPVAKLPLVPQPSAHEARMTVDAGSASPPDCLFASTVVTRGVAVAEVTATAERTAVGRIGADLAATVEPPSGLQQRSRPLVHGLGLGAVLLAATQVMLAWWWNGRPLLDSLLSGSALAILPEEIPVILTVLLALGAWRIARRQVLTRWVTAVEALGSITVLAVDKTGTLTLNRMAVVELATADGCFRPQGATSLPESFHRLAEFAALATPGDPFDPMEQAIQDFCCHWLAGTEHVHEGLDPVFEYPLSPDILAMTRVFSMADPGSHLLAAKGAPEAVADLCHLDPQRRDEILAQVDRMAERGLRMLAGACLG